MVVMGRGNNTEAISNISSRDEGEIEMLDAERLEDHSQQEARTPVADSTADKDDERALKNIIEQLAKTPSASGKTPDELEDQAIDLYNSFCQLIREKKASEKQLQQAAALFGETPEKLRKRLADRSSSGSSGLLSALAR